MISIIIPCLNEEHYIGKILTCLHRQTFKDFEVIVVDGDSRDRTVAIVKEFDVKLFQPHRRGVSFQRNFGAAQAKYERLLFLDADTQIKPHFLQHTLEEIKQRKLELATCDFEPLSSRVDDKLLYFLGCVYFRARQFIEPAAMGWCFFSTKRVHAALNGFDESIRLGEDVDYAKRASERGIMLRVLSSDKVYVSVRRLSDEGRLNYVKKAVLSEVYRTVNSKLAQEMFEYEFGKFKEDVEAMKLEEKEKSQWKKLLRALRMNML
jgi:glycosyltransferase involved in cell wall biosynthesis